MAHAEGDFASLFTLAAANLASAREQASMISAAVSSATFAVAAAMPPAEAEPTRAPAADGDASSTHALLLKLLEPDRQGPHKRIH